VSRVALCPQGFANPHWAMATVGSNAFLRFAYGPPFEGAPKRSGEASMYVPTCLFDERAPRQDVLDLDAGMNGKRRAAIRQYLIDGFHGIAAIIVDTGGSGLDAAIAQHTAF
jgi:hypothetical protein